MYPRNRGKHPNDDKLFSEKWQRILTTAADDLCYLLSKGYAVNSSLQIVGNRYKLNKRQRIAVSRISCSDEQSKIRINSSINAHELQYQNISIDGFNLLILIESALSGGYIFKTREGAYRDISSVHSTYKPVKQTEPAIRLIGQALVDLGVGSVHWYLDKPISNSGKLKSLLLSWSYEHHVEWNVSLVYAPDKELVKSDDIAITSDGWILDNTDKWFNLAGYIIESYIQEANIIEV